MDYSRSSNFKKNENGEYTPTLVRYKTCEERRESLSNGFGIATKMHLQRIINALPSDCTTIHLCFSRTSNENNEPFDLTPLCTFKKATTLKLSMDNPSETKSLQLYIGLSFLQYITTVDAPFCVLNVIHNV